MPNRPTIAPPTEPAPPKVDDLPRLRSFGVLADVAWRLSPAIDDGMGRLVCLACVEGTGHATARPVRRYRELYLEFIALRVVQDVVTFVERNGFPKDDDHWGRRSPAAVDPRLVLRLADEIREDRRLLLGMPSHRHLLEPDLVSRADAWRAAMAAEVSALKESEPDPERRWLLARSRVRALSADSRWRESAEAASWRRIAREVHVRALQGMTTRWRADAEEPMVELVTTSLLQLVSFALLQEARGDAGVAACLECGNPLDERPSGPGRPRLYCPPASGRTCARDAEYRHRRGARRSRSRSAATNARA
jgi:hypothetical protein